MNMNNPKYGGDTDSTTWNFVYLFLMLLPCYGTRSALMVAAAHSD
jgi:hypothetical protein